MVAVRVLAWIVRLSGLVALALGLLFWFALVDWITFVLAGTYNRPSGQGISRFASI